MKVNRLGVCLAAIFGIGMTLLFALPENQPTDWVVGAVLGGGATFSMIRKPCLNERVVWIGILLLVPAAIFLEKADMQGGGLRFWLPLFLLMGVLLLYARYGIVSLEADD